MPPIGETLREARMRQGLDIADVESRTKIRAKYLRALESEDWGLLPGPTFVKTFLRTYAEVVGVDPHLLVEEYRAGHEPRDETELAPLTPGAGRAGRAGSRERRRRPRGGGPPARWPLFAAAAVALVAFLLVLGLLDGGGGDKSSSTATTAARTQTATTPARRRAARARRPGASAGVTVRLAPSAPTYACLDKGPGTPVIFEGTLSAARTFKDARMIRVNLGKRGVDLRANGRRVTIAPGPQPVGYAITRSSTRELPIGQRPCA